MLKTWICILNYSRMSRTIISLHQVTNNYMNFSTLSHRKPQPVPGISCLIVPALLYGCSIAETLSPEMSPAMEESVISLDIKSTFGQLENACLDIFIFNDDQLQRLDSYTRMERFSGNVVPITSRSGEKIVFICINGQRSLYEWSEISSYSSLSGLRVNLEEESVERPVMTGEFRTSEDGRILLAEVTPIASMIELRSISSDFSGKPYQGMKITDAKVYLTNVNAEYPLIGGNSERPVRIINSGMLNSSETGRFSDRSIIVREMEEDIGTTGIKTGISLMCYPNCSVEEGLGAPFTRLVVEGRIGGSTCYWPINVNRHGAEAGGVARNCRYVYDIVLKRKGTDDPDTPIDPEEFELNLTVMPWTEKEEYQVGF